MADERRRRRRRCWRATITRLIDEGGNIYFLGKIFSTDGKSFVQAVSTMTGASVDEHQAMMIAGGRSVEGLRSKRAAVEALAAVAAEAAETTGETNCNGAPDRRRRVQPHPGDRGSARQR